MNHEVTSYSAESKVFHWLVAFIVIFMLSFSFFMEDMAKENQPVVYMIHKSFGLTILLLMILRFVWIKYRGKPVLSLNVPLWQRYLARGVQYGLYFFLIAMPISGWIMSVAAGHPPTFFNLFSVPLPIEENEVLANTMANVHGVIAWIIISLLVLHVAGAFKHYFFDKDQVLQTMLPRRKK